MITDVDRIKNDMSFNMNNVVENSTFVLSEDFNRSESDSAETWTLVNHIWIYTAPLILLFGVCGNILTIVVMSRPRMKGTSTSIYLRLLALGDMTVVIVGLTPEWLSQLHLVDLWDLHPWVCKIELYLYYTSLDFAIWMLVAFNCDRFIAVCFPLRKRRLCTARRALIVSGSLLLFSNINAHVLFTRGADYNNQTLIGNCRYLSPYVNFEISIRPPLVLVFAFIIPFIIIATCNSIIIIKTKAAKHIRERKLRVNTCRQEKHRRVQHGFTQTTIMCLATSIAFLILVLPNIILFIGKKWWSGSDDYQVAKALASQLIYIHHSINFLLLSLTGSRFRRELAMACGQGHQSPFMQRLRQMSFNSSSSTERKQSFFRFLYGSRSAKSSPADSPIVLRKSKNVENDARDQSWQRARYSAVRRNDFPLAPITEGKGHNTSCHNSP